MVWLVVLLVVLLLDLPLSKQVGSEELQDINGYDETRYSVGRSEPRFLPFDEWSEDDPDCSPYEDHMDKANKEPPLMKPYEMRLCDTFIGPQNYSYYNYSCPILVAPNSEDLPVTYTICSNNLSITSVSDLLLLPETTVLCLANTSITKLEANAFLQFHHLRFLNLSHNTKLAEISNLTFQGLDHLILLDLTGISVTVIHPETFGHLPNLTRLSLAKWVPSPQQEEHLSMKYLQGLAKTKISDLELSGVNKASASGFFWELTGECVSGLRNTAIQNLWLRYNQIITIRKGVVEHFPFLQKLWISHNLLLGGDVSVLRFWSGMRELRFLNMNYQNYVELPRKKLLKRHITRRCQVYLKLPPKLNTVCIGYNNIVIDINTDNVCVDGHNTLKALYVPQMLMTHRYNGGLKHLPALEKLVLYHSRIYIKDFAVFQDLTNLTFLNLSMFRIDKVFELSNQSRGFKLKKLEILDMSHNFLESVPEHFFTSFESLTELHLKVNLFQNVPLLFAKLPKLRYIDLSYNQISHIPYKAAEDWYNASVTRGNVTVILSNNTIMCYCSDINMIEKVQNTEKSRMHFIGFRCHFESGQVWDIRNVYVNRTISKCNEGWLRNHVYVPYIAYLLLLLASCLPASVYRFRHNLQYMWLYIKIKLKQNNKELTNSSFISYDTLLCCHIDDIAHLRLLYQTLEGCFQYRLFIMERDSLCGKTMADAINDAFSRCNSVILVISRNAVRGQYFKYIVHLARERRDLGRSKVICLFMNSKDEFLHEGMSGPLEYLVRTSLCLQWDTRSTVKSVFWMSLRQELGPPLFRNYI